MAPDTADTAMGGSCPSVFREFSPEVWLSRMSGPLADTPALALAQIESTVYLRNQLLRDSDWASMDHSVELRTPLVDAHLLKGLTKFLPHFHRFPGKTLLANAPLRPLPAEFVRRRKTGFGIPVRKWVSDILGEGASWQAELARHAGIHTP